MPVLARTLEATGLSTILVTPMPFWAEKIGVLAPRFREMLKHRRKDK